MIIKKILCVIVSFASVFLMSCAYDPIIIESHSKVPLIENNVIDYSGQKKTKKNLKSSLSLEESRKKNIENRGQKLKNTEFHMQQLSLEIELLALENERIRQKTEYQKKYKLHRGIVLRSHQSKVMESTISKVTSPIQYATSNQYALIKNKIASKKKSIQNVLSSFDGIQYAHSELVIVEDTDSTQQEKKLFHTVYVLKEKQSWLILWDLLEKNKVYDKWRGVNKVKGIYFVYVGSYSSRLYAIRRRDSLAKTLGQKPIVITGLDSVIQA